MRPSNFRPKNIGIYTLPGVEEAEATAGSMIQYLEAAGAQTFVCTSRSDECLRRQIEEGSVDVMIALGGDGTMLRAGRLRSGQELSEWQVLNEVVVCRGQFVRPIRVRASVDGYQLAAYVADGLIAATPTGSTAYALAAGGPIMPPELRNILIIPIAPHLSVDRGIILPEGAKVTITALTNHEAVLSVDGQSPVTVLDGDEIEVEASSHAASFIRFQDPSYFYSNLTHYMEQNPVTGNLP